MKVRRWKLLLALTFVLLGVSTWMLATSFAPHPETDAERKWRFLLLQSGVDLARAERMATESRDRLATDIAALETDINRGSARAWINERDAAQDDHALTWRLRAIPSTALAGMTLALALYYLLRKPRRRYDPAARKMVRE